MVENSDVVGECSSCVRLKQEIEIARKDQAATLKMIKEKIMSTDKLIKKYQKKCDDFDKQAKQLKDLTTKHENCERNTEILQEQLSHSLEVTEPQKKTIKRLIQEKFIAEETIQELKQKNIEQEEVINQLKHGIQLRDEKDSSWKLEQQLQAKQIEKEKKRVERLTKELEKAKEEIKKGKGLVREKNRELRGVARKCDNFEFQMKKLKDELKYIKKDGGYFYQSKRKLSPREFSITRSSRQSVKRCEEKLEELLSDSTKEYKSPTEEKPALTSIFDEMTNIANHPLSPVPPSPTESEDSSSESSDDHSSGSDSDSDGGSLGDLGEILELNLEKKGVTNEEAATADNLSFDGDEGGCLGTESVDEDIENKIEPVSPAKDDKGYENSEQIIQEKSDKESIPDSYLEKEQKTPEKIQSEKQVTEACTLEDSDTKCKSPLSIKDQSIISSEELTSVPTSEVPSDLSTRRDSTAENIDTDENTLEVVGNETISADKMSCQSFDKETIEEVDIKNNNLSLSSSNKGLKDVLSAADEKENEHITKNVKVICSEKDEMSATDIPNNVRTGSAQGEDRGNTCGAEDEAVHTSVNKTSSDDLFYEKNVRSLDLDKSLTKDKFKDDDVEFADHTTSVLPEVDNDKGNHTKDESISEDIQENETFLLTDGENTSKHTEYVNELRENELKDDIISDVPRKLRLPESDDRDDALPNEQTKIIKDSLNKFGERLGNTLPGQQVHEMECEVSKNVDEKVGLLGKNLDNIGDEETSSPKGDTEQIALNLTIENSHNENPHKQTSVDTKSREKSIIQSSGDDETEKTSLLPKDVNKILKPKGKEVVDENEKATRISNTEVTDTNKQTSTMDTKKCEKSITSSGDVERSEKTSSLPNDDEKVLELKGKEVVDENEKSKRISNTKVTDTNKQTSMDTKNCEKSITSSGDVERSEKTSSLPNDGENVLGLKGKEVVDENGKSTRISNTEVTDTNKQTSMDTKNCEKSVTLSGSSEDVERSKKTSSLPNNGDKVLELKEGDVVHKSVKGIKRSKNEASDRRKRQKRVASPEVVATPSHVNCTPTKAIDHPLDGTQTQSDSELFAAETSGDGNDTVPTREINCDSIHSNDNTLSNNVEILSNAEEYAMKCHLGSAGDLSELSNEQENVAVKKSSCQSVDNKTYSDPAKRLNKDEADCDVTSGVMVMNEGTEEVLEEGGTNEVVDTNTSVLDAKHGGHLSNDDALGIQNDSGKTMMAEIEALISDDAADSNLTNENNPADESYDFTTIKESILIDTLDKAKSKSTISDPSVPSLSSAINDCFNVFDEEMPMLSPLPPSPSSSRESSPTREFDIEEDRTPSLFTSLPTLAAFKPKVHMTSLSAGASRISSASSVSQASLTTGRHRASQEYKRELEPLMKLEIPRQDVFDGVGHKQVKELALNKQTKKKLSVRPTFLSEIQYANKVFRYLTQEHAKIDDVVSRLSNAKTMSSGVPFVNALVKFQHNEDLMPIIIQKYYDRDRQHQEQSSRLSHLNNWTPVLSVFEERVCVVVTRLSQVENLKGLSTKVMSLLSSTIIHSCSAAEEPDKRCIASHCRLICALCRTESNLQRMRVLCYDIIRSLYSRPGTVLYLMISIAAVWPTVLASSTSVSTTSRGLVCLAGESYQPLPCTIQVVLTTWARTNDWVLLGNVLDWLCAWKQVPSGVLSLEQLVGELFKLMKDPSFAQLMHDKDGIPILGFGLYEVIKALELVSCVLGWTWLNNVLVREYLWDILAHWINRTQPKTNCTATTTPCLDRNGSCNDGSESLSTSVSQNKEDMQRTNSDAGHTSNSHGSVHDDPQDGTTDQVPESTVVAAIRLLGLVCRIAIQHYQTIPQVIPLLVSLLQTAEDCSVPYAVQLASAYSLLEVSPWQPCRVVSVLDEWKTVQDKSNPLPESLIQGLNSLKICSQPSRDASVLFDNCKKTDDNDDVDIDRDDEES